MAHQNNHNTYDIAFYCVYVANKNETYITNVDLQIILYMLQERYIKKHHKPLFFTPIEPDADMPRVKDIYYRFAGYGAMEIKPCDEQLENFNTAHSLGTDIASFIEATLTEYVNTPKWDVSKFFDYKNSAYRICKETGCNDITSFMQKEFNG